MKDICCDQMTPIEREKALEQDRKVDRLPCTPMITDHASRLIGIQVSDYLFSSKYMAKAHLKAYEIYGHDNIGLSPDIVAMPEALGCKLKYFNDDRPQLLEPVIREYEDIEKLFIINPDKDGRLHIYLDALDIIREEIGQEVRVGTGIGGPFTIAGLLRGTSTFIRDVKRNPEFVHKLLSIVTSNIKEYIQFAYIRGYTCSLGEPLASNSIIGPKCFREFVKPYIIEIVDFYKNLYGKGPSLHICGKTDLIWKDIADAGVRRFSVDNEMDLEKLKNSVGHKLSLAGNVSPVDVLLYGTRKMVINSSLNCLEKAWDNPKGFSLSSGCTIALNTPPENIKAMMEAARIFNSK